ncbi:hypothetical protein O5O45_08340 [Hahella aquimaris]|uniref:hypothetical protein n=1 Tax=Hahella sp. HNIBRBA332 TaxID=3015983 RepID=UPI00273B81C2|nr:hypothetical protein [Hahella sp. HNIBRBA332]WLQ15922.1 hypothetical protein O5O45_08340 [Hahella sp. HNIBRBA332]
MADDKVTFSVRLIGVEKRLLEKFNHYLDSFSPSIREYFKDKTKLVFSIEVTKNVNIFHLCEVVKALKEHCTVDIFVSVSSDLDSDIIDVPRPVVDIIAVTGANLVF